MKISDFMKFYKLVKNRTLSEKHYIAFQEFQANLVLQSISRHVSLKGKVLLDIGCGRGGYTKVFKKSGANVISLDLEMPQVRGIFPAFVQGDATQLPFIDNSFDFVYSSSLIEHLPEPIHLLHEVHRVLKKGGTFYLSFPPFYTPVGGHQFKPFNMFLPEKIATFLSRKIYGVKSYKYNDRWGKLHIMTIAKAKKLISKAGFVISRLSTRFLKVNLAKVPFLNELLTWHVEFYLKK